MLDIIDKKDISIRHYVCVPNRWKDKGNNIKRRPIREDEILQMPKIVQDKKVDIQNKNIKMKNGTLQELDISDLKNEIKNIKIENKKLKVEHEYLSLENIMLSEEISILRDTIYSLVRENMKIKRDTIECAKCGKYTYLPKENYHHIIPRKYNGENGDYNRIPLCYECHNYVEIETEEWISSGKNYDIETLRSLIINDNF